RYSLLRQLQELLRGELALGLDLAEGPNDGRQHLLASAHGGHGVTDGRNHGQHLISRESVSQELAGRLLEPNKAERGFSGVNFELPEESLGSLCRAKKGLESDLGLLEIGRQFDANCAQARNRSPRHGSPTGHIAAEGERCRDGLTKRFWQRAGLALDGAGEGVPLPLGAGDAGNEAAGVGNQCDVKSGYLRHASSPPAREKLARRRPIRTSPQTPMPTLRDA